MLPMQSIEGPAAASAAEENGETRQQKPKTLPCKYCSKRFRRVEHVQRHERTHTKEKPFSCGWARCGKTFGRRDLLVRHEKLVHLNDGNKDNNRPRKPSSAGGSQADARTDTDMLGMQQRPTQASFAPEPMTVPAVSSLAQNTRVSTRTGACNLDLLSDAATHLASTSGSHPVPQARMMDPAQPIGSLGSVKTYDEGIPYGDRGREQDPNVLSSGYQPAPAAFDDYNSFLDDFPSSAAHFLPPSLESEHSFGAWSRAPADMMHRGPSKPPSQYPSRFPSLQPDPRDAGEVSYRMHEDTMRAPTWRISGADHVAVKNRLDEFSSVLPDDFVFPSRHTLIRFLEGYINGFHEHLPVLHIPTLSPTELSPELLLAILAVGAQYRFESHRGNALWYAARAVALEQVRRRHSHEVHGLLPTPAAYSPHSTRPSPSSGLRHSFPSVQQDRPMTQDTHREPYSPNTPQSRLETIQALLLLFAIGLWGAKAILHEALSLQSQLALLVREEGLTVETNQSPDWETWIRHEGSSRTKLIAYCFFNLSSIAYNTPPTLLTSEINLYLPAPSRMWRAETAWQWQEARHSSQNVDFTLQDAFSRVLSRQSQGPPGPLSSLGSYVVIHAILQHIYLLKQTSFTTGGGGFEVLRGLKHDDVETISQALRIWQLGFEEHGGIRPNESNQLGGGDFQGGPVAFNSTALLNLAYIRLCSDLSPARTLDTRDHLQIANAFNNTPLLMRTPRLHRAVYRAIHALSMLVKAGVNYVARTKSLEWSMQHSLCNLECAVLLSKWLLTLASIGLGGPSPSPDERNLLEMVRRMLDETEFAVPIDPSLSVPRSSQAPNVDMAANDGTKLRQLAVAVIRLWAETFKGNHVFELVHTMGSGLESYADLLERPRDKTPLVRLAPGSALG